MYGSYMSRQSIPPLPRDLDRDRNFADLISKVNSLERTQEKLFHTVENQGHELRALIETLLSEIRQSHDLINMQSRESRNLYEREMSQMRGMSLLSSDSRKTSKPRDRELSRILEDDIGNRNVETHIIGIHDAVNTIVSYMKDRNAGHSIEARREDTFVMQGQPTIHSEPKDNQKTTQDASANQTQNITTLSSGFGDKFRPKLGSWECTSCFTRNNEDVLECLACEVLKPGQKHTVREWLVMEKKPPSVVTINNEELSINGMGLKLNTEEDAKILNAISAAEIGGDSRRMKILTLSGNSIGIEAAKGIGKSLEFRPELKRAHWNNMFTGRGKKEIPDALQYLNNGMIKAGVRLVELDLSDNALGPIGIEAINNLLKSLTCTTLKELKLNNTGLGVTGGKMLAKTLLEAYHESVKLNFNRRFGLKVFVLGRSRQENEGAVALAEVFKKMGTLEKILMPQNGICQEGIAALADALDHNPNLRVLDLSDNTITPAGAKTLAPAIAYLKNLESLNLGDCLLGTEGAKLVSDGLKQSGLEKLRELYLESNEIKLDGGLSIVNAIKNCNTIEYLAIDNNEFGEQGCRKILNILEDAEKPFVVGGRIKDDCGSDNESEGANYAEESQQSFTTPLSEKSILGGASAVSTFVSLSNAQQFSNANSLFGENVEECRKDYKEVVADSKQDCGTNESEGASIAEKSLESHAAPLPEKSIFNGATLHTASEKSIFGGASLQTTMLSEKSIFGGANSEIPRQGCGSNESEGANIVEKSHQSYAAPLPEKSIFNGATLPTTTSEKSIFGGASSISTFASLSKPNATPVFGKKDDRFSFAGAGKSLFSSIKAETGDQNETYEDQVDDSTHDPHFEPVIPLPALIEVHTGEEEEKEIFKYRAKVFRFDNDIKQWKERGIGDIKILKHPGRMTYRILLRREQTLKVACNHLISEEMELKPLSTSETSLWWSAVDHADGEAQTEVLAVKFKTVETRNDFKKVFEDAQEEIKANRQ